jgi:DNA-binding MarR family transcriptional regulator
MIRSEPTLDIVKSHIIEVARELGVSCIDLRAENLPNTVPGAAALRFTTAKAWQRAGQVRRDAFGDGGRLFADPAWEMLLDLYVRGVERNRVSVSDACAAARVPQSTGLRWLGILHQAGLLNKSNDSRDRRRSYVELTAAAVEKIELALDRAADSDRRLGLGRLQHVGRTDERASPVSSADTVSQT